ncbi:hypothetical protein WJX72_010832 [[Myrmecia] bisecta]|uniref:Uncharacterized protein n=1 Tax=[Myrmecia] bisecta TaxID=41462 RepID=A0AAW1R9M6_9CHLO
MASQLPRRARPDLYDARQVVQSFAEGQHAVYNMFEVPGSETVQMQIDVKQGSQAKNAGVPADAHQVGLLPPDIK